MSTRPEGFWTWIKSVAFLSQMHGSPFEGVNFMSINMPWMTSAHLLPEDFNPYKAFTKIKYIFLVLKTLGQQLCRSFYH